MPQGQKTALWIVVAVVVIGLGIYLWAKPQNSMESGEMASSTDMVSTSTAVKPVPKAGASAKPSTGSAQPTATSPSTVSNTPASNVPVTLSGNVAVSIEGNAFSPVSLKVKKGTTVTWTNKDTVAHTVTGEQNAGPGSGDLIIGKSYSYTFDKVGEFPYFCARHTFMRGFVEVIE